MDHPFIDDKSLFDVSSSDLRELWDTDIEPNDFKIDDDWNSTGDAPQPKSHVVLNDKLMSEALISSDTPIKTEHSYCSQLSAVCSSPLHSGPVQDDDDDLLTAVVAKSSKSRPLEPFIIVKTEPRSKPCSPASSCPSSPSPRPNYTGPSCSNTKSKPIGKNSRKHCSSSTVADKMLGAKRKRQMTMANMIQIELSSPSHARFPLPPTPPSCASSDNEGNISPSYPSSPSHSLFTSVSTTTRQPIQTSLISTQPKGSTGILLLTEEEKRTLIAEGYPIPVRLPLTKAEEKCLKKIRRKIKNKISAQESRRKKKEYMDALEKKVQDLSSENSVYRRQISSLEDTNSNLSSQVTKLQGIITLLGGVNSKNLVK